jgi:hypothetical protein
VNGHTQSVSHYSHRDDPALLIALLRGAIVGRTPVVLTWIDGTAERAAVVQPTLIDPSALHTKVRTEEGVTVRIHLWDVAAAEVADAEGWAA